MNSANLGLLILGLFCIGSAVYAIKTGTLHMRGRFDKDSSPSVYRAGVYFYFIAGIICLGLGLFL